jgi:hypothetical protein
MIALCCIRSNKRSGVADSVGLERGLELIAAGEFFAAHGIRRTPPHDGTRRVPSVGGFSRTPSS